MKYLNDLYQETEQAYRKAQQVQNQAAREMNPASFAEREPAEWERRQNSRTWVRKKNDPAPETLAEITGLAGERGGAGRDETRFAGKRKKPQQEK